MSGHVNNIHIESNAALANIDGLANLTSAAKLYLITNPSLSSVEGLRNLASVGEDLIIAGPITTLAGLRSLRHAQRLDLAQTRLTNLAELRGVTIGSLDLFGNLQLETSADLTGTAALLSELVIIGNPKLQDLTGLESLENVSSQVQIQSNAGLRSLDGLQNLTNTWYLWFSENPRLSSLAALTSLADVKQVGASMNASLPTCEVRALVIRVGAGNLGAERKQRPRHLSVANAAVTSDPRSRSACASWVALLVRAGCR